MTLADRSVAALSSSGPASQGLPGFVARPTQQRLAEAIADAIDAAGTLIAEAGTGTGKTYAYLVPVLLSGLRAIVSTGTKALQDQLFERDLPRMRDALGVSTRTALLKGRANYVCVHRLDQARREGRFATREIAAQLVDVVAWAGRTRSGDVAELVAVPEDSPLWPQVTSTTDNCLGSECPLYDECFVVRARREAQDADIVVVNHHLLLADMALREEGFGEILPGAHVFVLDEAHQVPELASQFFSRHVSTRQLLDLGRDVLAETAQVTGSLATLRVPVAALEQAVRQARLTFEDQPSRGPLQRVLALPGVLEGLRDMGAALEALVEALAPLVESSVGFEHGHERASDLMARLQQMLGDGDDKHVRWYEISPRGFSLSQTPLDVSGPLRGFRERTGAAWVFTSATLAVGGHFDHFARQLGLDAPETLLESSPFDYPNQALAYLPKGLPEPSDRSFVTRLLDAVLPVIEASKGRAFLLFTSHRALREAAEQLPDRCDYPLFVQGTQPRTRLLEAFRDSGNGVLLGAASFWEGVDVAGDALSVVVIDKLPFAAPDDPVLEARLDVLRRGGGNPFRDWQLPAAVIALKQGAGRLIRTHDDRGVLVLGDTRLVTKPYGRLFIDSLPPFARTREVDEVVRFLHDERTGRKEQIS
ncbi:MAG: ATP-dependent DNA helicase [Xanthomonadales bacterium]|nr:ATP-dependent DNA helicase [Xanthomonadales bacterium]